eukprot:jgi/Botrbrau1/19636/Bobra.0003s0006.1
MLALTLPLYILLVIQAILGLTLLTPVYVARPAIALAKHSKSPIGLTVLGTISVFLGVLLIPPLVEINTINRHTSKHASEVELANRRESEASAYLSLVMTLVCLLWTFLLQKLGVVLGEREQLRLSQGALLKQVHGLSAEYDRLNRQHSSSSGTGAIEAATSKLQSALTAAEKDKAAYLAQLEEAVKARKTAEANAAALKTQSKGLENEYDRLLAELDMVKRRLRIADPTYSEDAGPRSKDT